MGQGLGPQSAALLGTAIGVVAGLLLAFLAARVTKRIVIRFAVSLAHRTSTGWDDAVLRRRVLHRFSHFTPALVAYLMAIPVFADYPQLAPAVR